MNWNIIEGNWKQLQGVVRQQWGKLTDDDIEVIDGDREELSGRIQEAYGISQQEADKQIERFAGAIEAAVRDAEESEAGERATPKGESH